jgi:hypothetical protein
MENEVWPWVLMCAALYLLAGFIVYVVIEARNAGNWVPEDYFTPLEMALIVFTWPVIALYMLQIYLRKWGNR